jgi:excisionase family DNA binding protein
VDKNDMTRFVTTGQAAKRIGVTGMTLRNWAEVGEIEYVRTHTGRYRFDAEGYLAKLRDGTTK